MNNHFEGADPLHPCRGGRHPVRPIHPFTQTSAWAYLAARIAYIPAYAFGLSPLAFADLVRSGFFATVLMILAALF